MTDITDEELISQCILFFLAGYDTTASLISTACYSLATNPEKQDQFAKEIENCLTEWDKENPETNDPYQLASFENLNHFEYLTGVINETLRLYAPLGFTERQASNDIRLATSDDRTYINVKKGDILHIPVYSLHHNKDYFPEPDKFIPERFIGTQTHPKYAYLPFGLGPRNCIAKSLALLEAKIALFHIFRNYKLSTCENTTVNLDSNIVELLK